MFKALKFSVIRYTNKTLKRSMTKTFRIVNNTVNISLKHWITAAINTGPVRMFDYYVDMHYLDITCSLFRCIYMLIMLEALTITCMLFISHQINIALISK